MTADNRFLAVAASVETARDENTFCRRATDARLHIGVGFYNL
jgi:hypothetical protein